MSEDFWTITSYVIPASYIRGFARGVRNEQTGGLRLAVKQYVPKKETSKDGGITLIAAQGLGQSKELYQPFFDGLLNHAKLPIRAIWSMDCVHHGASYVLNESIIGDEHHWFDSSRDLLQMINHFQDQMPPPIYGMGQSWGASTITMASVMHPRLFSGIVSVEAVLGTGLKGRTWLKNEELPQGALLIIKRRETWPTRDEARRVLSSNPFFKEFDQEVFNLSITYDLRDCPTAECPKGVTLTTPKALQLATMLIADPPLPGYPPGPQYIAEKNNIAAIRTSPSFVSVGKKEQNRHV